MWLSDSIKEIFHEPTKKDLKKGIKQSKNFEESKEFLENLLKKLSENQLTDKEKNFLNNQIQEHEELKQLYNKVLKEKELLWNETITDLNNLFQKDINSIIWEENFNYIQSQIENWEEKFKFFREKVKSCIDIKRELEDIYETQNIEFFINQFTLRYINFLDKKYNNAYEFVKKNDFKNLLLNKNDLDNILKNIIVKFIKKWINLDKTIDFYTIKEKQTINLNEFRKELLLKIKIEKEEQTEIKIIKEKYNLWVTIIGWNISNEWLKKIKSILKTDVKDKDKLKKMYINKILLGENLITKEQLLSMMEKEKKFNYLDFLDKFGLTWKIKKVALDIMQKININITEQNKDKLLYNLKIFLMFIISMESDGYNVKNSNNSWAEGYFQYKWTNGDWKTDYSSFETALRRSSKYFTDSFWIKKDDPDWIKKPFESKNRWKITPIQLSTQQQTILFLCDVFVRAYTKWRKKWSFKKAKFVRKELKNILINGNQWSMKLLYKYVHHTKINLDYVTKKRLENKMKTFFRKQKK